MVVVLGRILCPSTVGFIFVMKCLSQTLSRVVAILAMAAIGRTVVVLAPGFFVPQYAGYGGTLF